jgi:hypothetical protein
MKRFILGCAAVLFSGIALGQLAFGITPSGTDSTDQNSIVKIGYHQVSVDNAITAFAGGGQTNAYQLQAAFNRVTVVATPADSVKLPALCNTANVGLQIWVANADTTDALNVFPPVGDVINLLSANTAISVPNIKSMLFTCVAAATWQSTVSN